MMLPTTGHLRLPCLTNGNGMLISPPPSLMGEDMERFSGEGYSGSTNVSLAHPQKAIMAGNKKRTRATKLPRRITKRSKVIPEEAARLCVNVSMDYLQMHLNTQNALCRESLKGFKQKN